MAEDGKLKIDNMMVMISVSGRYLERFKLRSGLKRRLISVGQLDDEGYHRRQGNCRGWSKFIHKAMAIQLLHQFKDPTTITLLSKTAARVAVGLRIPEEEWRGKDTSLTHMKLSGYEKSPGYPKQRYYIYGLDLWSQSEGSENSESFEDSGRSDEEYSKDGASSKEGGYEIPLRTGKLESYSEALSSKEFVQWKKAIIEEMVSLEKNQTCSLVRLPAGKKASQSLWMFRVKEEQDDSKRYTKNSIHLVKNLKFCSWAKLVQALISEGPLYLLKILRTKSLAVMFTRIPCIESLLAMRRLVQRVLYVRRHIKLYEGRTAVDDGQKADAEPIQMVPSTPNDVTLVNDVQLAHWELTTNVVGMGDEDSDNEVKEVFNKTTGFMASKSGGGIKSKSVYERWKEDYDYNPYDDDDDDYKDLTDEQLAIRDAFDINVRGYKKKDAEPTIEYSNSNPFNVLNSVEKDVDFGTNASKEVGYGTNSLLEQWEESYRNGDYDFDLHDDDMYEGQDIPDKIQDICDNLDIKVRGRKKK
nr:retrovirus-related Pol polyprotein from transposon TNT 1-94 [Tanacetum cinerariifolium]